MWIAFRLIVALIGFVLRQVCRTRKPAGGESVEGRIQFVHLNRNKKEKLQGFTIGVALEAPIVFRLHLETASDRLFKKVGLATEIETGDATFDRKVYVVCDHPLLAELLKHSAEARAAVSAALDSGFSRISFDGHVIWLDKSVPREPTPEERGILGALGKSFAPLERGSNAIFTDPFFWRALVVEGLVWSIAAYGVGAFLSTMFQDEDIHLDQGALVLPGLGIAGLLFAALVLATIFLLRGSSRGHRLILESALVLLIGLPFMGIQTFADLNRALDSSRESIQTRIDRCETRVSTGSGRKSTSYYLHISEAPEVGTLPFELKTSGSFCAATAAGADATFVIGRGAFGRAWIREIRAPGANWSS